MPRSGIDMKRYAGIAAAAVIMLSGCNSTPTESTTETMQVFKNAETAQTTVQSSETSQTAMTEKVQTTGYIDFGERMDRGFVVDNTLHSDTEGDIHFSSYIPSSYDGTKPYALFVTLPGWEGLYFQGVGVNLGESFPFEAKTYNDEMIILSTQLDDWGETSALMAIALTEYFLANYNIDPEKVYLHGFSGGGETGSIVMGLRPELFTAYLMTSSKWDGDLNVLAAAKTPVYMAIGENDSYYGSAPLKSAYSEMHKIYEDMGLSESEINRLLVLDVREQEYFTGYGFTDQHGGGMAFAYDSDIMGWLFGEH